jgi:hypothetical protein
MKRFKFIILFLIVFVLIFPLKTEAMYNGNNFEVEDYNINIKVNSDNTFNVTQKILVNFDTYNSNIYLVIPMNKQIVDSYDINLKNNIYLSNIKVNDHYKFYTENGNYIIKIGSGEIIQPGSKEYIIKYVYNAGRDRLKGYDYFDYNLVGDLSNTMIKKVNFKITMPKKFDVSKISFASNGFGLTADDIFYKVDGNAITGIYDKLIDNGRDLTINCKLPEGYFKNHVIPFNFKLYFMFYIIPFIFLIISIILCFKKIKKDKIVDTVEFYPPEGFNSLEVAYLYKGNVNSSDVLSLLIYFANKGYVQIADEIKKIWFFKIKRLKITKLKEYDGINENEKMLFEGLFRGQSQIKCVDGHIRAYSQPINEVYSDELSGHFYGSLMEIIDIVNGQSIEKPLFEDSTTWKHIIIGMIYFLQFLIWCLLDGYYADAPLLFFDLILFLFDFMGAASLMIYLDQKKIIKNLKLKMTLLIIVLACCWAMAFWIFKDNINFMAICGFSLFCTIVMGLCLIPEKRTPYGQAVFGKIRGFKRFLATAEKEELDTQVESNPTYFYDILPYAYVLNVSNKWINKFENVADNSNLKLNLDHLRITLSVFLFKPSWLLKKH